GECLDVSDVFSGNVRTREAFGIPVREEVCRIDRFTMGNVNDY
ncbi:hypothetical protein A2U01_0095267, partial [Trifolium medium]|nr:hypothetical protein [Trifolium medium]